MKQILTVFFCLLVSITGYAENKIKMVTYFPVPYVAYSKVNVTKQLDVGLTNACSMNLGCTESGNAGLRPLHVTNSILNKGKLELNTAVAISGSTVTIGSGSGSGSMNFNSNLRVNTLNDGVSVEANNMTVDTLKLFPNRITTDFPSCASTGAPGTPNISWQKLKLKDKEEVYLMCGNAKEAAPSCVAGEWSSTRYLASSTYDSMLSNDCSYVGCGGNPNSPCSDSGMYKITKTCTDYYTISRSSYVTSAEIATIGRSDQDTCNGDDRATYVCDGKKTSCVDIRLKGSPGYPQWKLTNTLFRCSNGWTSGINWGASSILEVPECGSAGNLNAAQACSYFRTGPGGQDNFFCYKRNSYNQVCSGNLSNPIGVTYLQNCPTYVRYNITCTPRVEYKVRTITCG